MAGMGGGGSVLNPQLKTRQESLTHVPFILYNNIIISLYSYSVCPVCTSFENSPAKVLRLDL